MTNCLICCCRICRFTAERQRAGGAGCAGWDRRTRPTLNYTRSSTDKPGIRITEGRHPVVEQVPNEPFIANPLNLPPQRRMLIITGPTIWAVKVPYAANGIDRPVGPYIGSYVPAQNVEIGPIDRIYPRRRSGRPASGRVRPYGGDDRNREHSA